MGKCKDVPLVCNGCKEPIDKKEVRMGFLEYDDGGNLNMKLYHMDCTGYHTTTKSKRRDGHG